VLPLCGEVTIFINCWRYTNLPYLTLPYLRGGHWTGQFSTQCATPM